jgi:hypothetical protein
MTSTRPSTSHPIHRRDPSSDPPRTVCGLSTALINLLTSPDPANVTCESCRASEASPVAPEDASALPPAPQLWQELSSVRRELTELRANFQACEEHNERLTRERDEALDRFASQQREIDALATKIRFVPETFGPFFDTAAAAWSLAEAAQQPLPGAHQGPPGHVTHNPAAERPGNETTFRPPEPEPEPTFTAAELSELTSVLAYLAGDGGPYSCTFGSHTQELGALLTVQPGPDDRSYGPELHLRRDVLSRLLQLAQQQLTAS